VNLNCLELSGPLQACNGTALLNGHTEDYIARNVMICIYHQYYPSDEMKKNEMDGACSKYGEERSCRVFVRKLEG
jgi:hypothetical protein